MTRILRTFAALLLTALVAAPVAAQGILGPTKAVLFNTDTGPQIRAGLGSPVGIVNLPAGSVWLQVDGLAGATLWTNVGGGTSGWTPAGGGGGGGGPHTLLGPSHSDTATAAGLRACTVVANASNQWSRVCPTSSGEMLRFGGTDTGFSTDGTGLTLNATNLTVGTLPAVAFPALTGDVTTTAGSLATTIATGAVTSAKIADGTILFADVAPNGCLAGQLWHRNPANTAWECTDPPTSGGTAHNLLSLTHTDTNPAATAVGDLLYADSGGVWTRLPRGTNGQFLSLVSSLPAWASVSVGGPITATGFTMATGKILGRTTASTGAIEEIAPGAGLSLSAGLLATSGPYSAAGFTLATARLLGRTTASSGAAEEITVGSGLALAAGVLSATATAAYCQTGEFDAGTSGTSKTLTWTNGNQQLLSLTGNLATLTLASPTSGCAYRVFFTQDATGGRTVTFPSSIKWGSLSAAPTVIATPLATTVCAFFYSGVAAGYQGFCDTGASSGGSGTAGGALVYLTTLTASASATVEFTGISSTYDSYYFDISGLVPSTSTADLNLRLGTGAGPTWDTAAHYTYAFQGWTNLGSAQTFQGTAATLVKIANSLNTAASDGVFGGFWVQNVNSATANKYVRGATMDLDSASNFVGADMWSRFINTAPVTGVQFYFGTGTAASGTIRVYGLAKTTTSGGGSSPVYTTGITVDGAGSAFSTGVKGFAVAQRAGTIQRVTLLSTDAAATACSVVMDVWKDTTANYPPTVTDTITASAKPTLASANKSQDATLTGWTKTVAAGDIFGYQVVSNTGCTRVTLTMEIQ